MQDDGILDSLGGSEEGLRQLFSPLSCREMLGSLQAGFVARVVTALIVKRPVPLLDWIQVSNMLSMPKVIQGGWGAVNLKLIKGWYCHQRVI